MNLSSNSPTLSFGQFEGVLAAISGVGPFDRSALTARLRLLARLGVPDLPRVGTGRRAAYDLKAVFQTALALELVQLSISTEAAARLVLHAWDTSLYGLIRSSVTPGDPWIILVNLEGFDGLSKNVDPAEVEAKRAAMSDGAPIPLLDLDTFRRAFGQGRYSVNDYERFKRIAIVNVSGLGSRLMYALDEANLVSRETFLAWCRAQTPGPHRED
jgi:hypothetical protein